MTMLDRLTDSFFNWRIMAEYLPKIVEGFVITVELALAVVVSGIACGFALAMIRSFRVKPVNFMIPPESRSIAKIRFMWRILLTIAFRNLPVMVNLSPNGVALVLSRDNFNFLLG